VSNYDSQGNLMVVNAKQTYGAAGGDTAGATLEQQVPTTWAIDSGAHAGPGVTISRGAVAGKSHYVCGIAISYSGGNSGDWYVQAGSVGSLIGQYGALFNQAFPNPIQIGQGQSVSLVLENGNASYNYRLSMWGYTA
jgi:hypothetical protein